MIRLVGEPEDVTTVEISGRALERIRQTVRWRSHCEGFLLGVLSTIGFCLALHWR